jgi:hypothetical protein
MVIRFRPGKLGVKPDSLTRRADYYLKRGDRDYTLANPQNLYTIFTQEQLATSLCATRLREVALDAASLVDSSIPILDSAALVEDIKAGLTVDPLANRELERCFNRLSPRKPNVSRSLNRPAPPWCSQIPAYSRVPSQIADGIRLEARMTSFPGGTRPCLKV